MSSIRFLNNLTTNAKGATAFKSTNNPVLDLFTYQNVQVPVEDDKFLELLKVLETSFVTNPELTLKLMKYKRLVKKGEGMRMLTYIMMLMVKEQDHGLYKELLGWYSESNKDLLRLARMSRMMNLPGKYELNLFVDNLFKALQGLIDSQSNVDLLPFKYLPSNGAHFEKERVVIRDLLNDKLVNTYKWSDIMNVVNSSKGRGLEVIKIMVNTYGEKQKYITNKSLRELKSYVDGLQYLSTPLLQGRHLNGNPFGYMKDDEVEYKMIGSYLSKLSTQALERIKKTIRKYSTETQLDARRRFLTEGLKQYELLVKEKPSVVKTTGLVLTEQIWNVFSGKESYTDSLGAQIKKQATELHDYLHTSFDDKYTCDDFVKELEVVIDYSGSMNGTPLETGLYHTLLLWESFNISSVIFFSNVADRVMLPKGLTIEEKIKHLYRTSDGSTKLEAAMEILRDHYQVDKQKKFVLVMTDGDCDYCFTDNGSNSPFHKYYEMLPEHRFCVFNLRQDKLAFPYLMDDPRVSYLGGNNMKVLIGVTKALVITIKTGKPFTPNDVLASALDLEDLEFDFSKYNFTYQPTYQYNRKKTLGLLRMVKGNIPKTTVTSVTSVTTSVTPLPPKPAPPIRIRTVQSTNLVNFPFLDINQHINQLIQTTKESWDYSSDTDTNSSISIGSAKNDFKEFEI
jgi:hypothetical protein